TRHRKVEGACPDATRRSKIVLSFSQLFLAFLDIRNLWKGLAIFLAYSYDFNYMFIPTNGIDIISAPSYAFYDYDRYLLGRCGHLPWNCGQIRLNCGDFFKIIGHLTGKCGHFYYNCGHSNFLQLMTSNYDTFQNLWSFFA